MANKQVNVNLAFNADTSKARKEMQDLQRQFDTLFKTVSQSTGGFTLDKELQKASSAALELQRHLSKAYNAETGKLDINTLSKSFADAGVTLDDYRVKLNRLGPEGEATFNKLATAILNAEVPLRKTNTLLTNFATTLKNTAKWQISSSLLHGFMGSIQHAYHYAQDLNESLNNIRIVTSKNTDQMAEFAKEANAAAQALSATTTEYTNASLIYYQQGLSDEEVKARTDATIKMANVSRQSAEDVSQQLTAIWNNFAKGGKDLEYYVDVITALGAATASSSAEIAEGLEKFAAAADTVGLSYEYATAALATVTATTRQSADIVGNAFKTLFARIESLKLGDTLEDSTDLNKYSEALLKVGINVKDVNGDLKDMDDILEEMGSTWQALSKDQQVALAQTVAGVRQYTQLIALMDNWDFFQQNVEVANGSEGTLDKQAKIYAEGWEAARDRVKVAAEEIYQKLLDDKFFINLTDAFGGFLKIIGDTVDALGGLSGVLFTLGGYITNIFGKQIISSIQNTFMSTSLGFKEWIKMQNTAIKGLEDNLPADSESKYAYESVIQVNEKALELNKKLTDEQKQQVKAELDILKQRAQALADLEKEVEKTKQLLDLKKKQKEKTETAYEEAKQNYNDKKSSLISAGSGKKAQAKRADAISSYEAMSDRLKTATLEEKMSTNEFEKLTQAFNNNKAKATELALSYQTMTNAQKASRIATNSCIETEEQLEEQQEQVVGGMQDLNTAAEAVSDNMGKVADSGENVAEKLPKEERITGAASGLMSFAMALKMVSGLSDTWADSSKNPLEKVLATATSLGFALPLLKKGIEGIGKALLGVEVAAAAPLAIITGVMLAFSAVSTYLKVSRENAAKEAEVLANRSKELSDRLNEEKESIKEVADQYKDLQNQYNNQEISLEELRNKVYDLCSQYGLEDLALQTLTADYEELTKVINDYQIAKNNEIIGQGGITKERTQNSLSAHIWKDLNESQRDMYGVTKSLDVGGAGIDKNLQEIFRQFGINTAMGGGHIDFGEFVNALTTDYEGFYNALIESNSKQALKLIQIIDDHKDLIEQYNEVSKQVLEAQKENIGLTAVNSANIDSANDFANIVKEIKQKALDEGVFEEEQAEDADKWAKAWLTNYDKSFSKYAQIYDITESVAEAIGGDPKKVREILEGYSELELAFIAKHKTAIASSTEELRTSLDSLKNYLNLVQSQANTSSITDILTNFNKNGKLELSEDDYKSINNLDNFGVSGDTFKGLSTTQQTIELVNYYIENRKAIQENADKAIEDLTDFQTHIQDKVKEINEDILKYEAELGDSLDELVGEENASLAEKYISGVELDDEENKQLEKLTKNNKALSDELERRKIVQDKINKATEKRDSLRNDNDSIKAEVEAIKEATSAWEAYTAAHTAVDKTSKELDNIQSAYSSLKDIIQSYNQNQGFTLDTMQALLALEPQYLEALQFENDELVLNKEYLVELTKGRLEQTKTLIYEEGYTKLLALAENDARVAAEQEAIAQAEAGKYAEIAGNQALGAAEKWRTLIAAMTNDSSIDSTARDQIIADTEKRIQAIDDVINNLDISSLDKKLGKSKKSETKELNEQLDRYWNINNAISSINNELDREEAEMKKLSSLQSRLFGKDLISNLQAQNKQLEKKNDILKEQSKNYEQLYRIQKGELDEIKTSLSAMGGQFAGDVLTNYDSLMINAMNSYRSAVLAYNASAQEEADKLQLQSVEKYYNKLKEYTNRYQDLYYNEMSDTYGKLEDLVQQQLENRLKILENNLQGWEVDIQLKLDTTDMQRQWNEFIKTVEQDFKKIFKDIVIESAFSKEGFELYASDLATVIKAMSDVEKEIDNLRQNGSSSMFASVTEAQDKLKSLQEQLIDQGNNLYNTYQDLWSSYNEGLDQVSNKLGKINSQYEKINDKLDYEKSLVELLYGSKAYDLMSKFYSAQQQNISAQIDSMKSQVDFWNSELQKAYQMSRDSVDLDDMSTWTSDMETAYSSMIEAQSKLNSLILEGVQTLQEDYLNSINQIVDTMNKNIWGMSLDDMKNDWEHIQGLAKEYLDDVEGAYEIQSLANKIDQGIAGTSTLKNQQKLQKLRESEISMLRQKEHLTQHDIDLAEARYQIALKEIALEEAQNSKTSMKLTRDTSGNWTYQYVADEDDVASKQQDLLDAYNNLYKIADDAYNSSMNLMMNTYQAMQEKMAEIAQDMTLTEEEKMLKIQEIYDTYLPEINAAVENAEVYRREATMASAAVFAEVCEQDMEAYETLADFQKQLVDEIRDKHLEDYEEIREAIVEGTYPAIAEISKLVFDETNENSHTVAADIIQTWAENPDSVKNIILGAIDEIQLKTEQYGVSLDNLQAIAGEDFGKINDAIISSITMVESLEGATEALCNNSSQQLDTLRNNLQLVADSWANILTQIIAVKTAAEEYMKLEGAAIETGSVDFDQTAIANGVKAIVEAANTAVKGATAGVSNSTSSEDVYLAPSPHGTPNTYETEISKENKLTKIAEANGFIQVTNGSETGWITLDQAKRLINQGLLEAFATGGYTGDWDDSGRLALLHQKELVLNKEDTKNMLDTVTAVRDLASLNDSIGSAIAQSISNLALNLITKAVVPSGYNSNTNTSNQIYVTAEFPNANDVETIREAILGLPNMASQFVH